MVPILSITLATYNVEQFVEECINSLLLQTIKDFELICIDDGSTDETLSILRFYETKDKRIKVIAKTTNEGLAVARNESLKYATGSYIAFLDGDDIYDVTLFEKAILLAKKEKADMIICDYIAFSDPSEIASKLSKKSDLTSLNKKDKVQLLSRPAFTGTKLIKTEVAKNLKIHFPEGYTRQDIPVHWHLITQIDRVAILPEKLVFYRQQPNATTTKKDKKLFHLAYVMDIVYKYLIDNKLLDVYKNEFYRQQLNLLFGMYDSIKNEYRDEALLMIRNRLTLDHYNYIKDKGAIRKQAKNFYLALQGSKINIIKYQTWLIARSLFRKVKEL